MALPEEPPAQRQQQQQQHTTKPSQTRQKTLRNPTWTYFHLTHLQPPSTATNTEEELDYITTHLTLRAATLQFGGLHASAIPRDILHLIPTTREVWLRVPFDNAKVFQAAVASYVGREGGWRVNGRSEWDVTCRTGRINGRRGGDELFL